MTEQEAREAIVEAGKVLAERGHVVSNDGNISVRIPGDRIVVTPTGVYKGAMDAGKMAVMDLDGNLLSGGGSVLAAR